VSEALALGEPPRGQASTWAPLRSTIFRALFLAQLVSNVGTLMQTIASSWLMGELGGSAALTSLVQAAVYLPVVVVGIPAGALADIFDRRRLLLITQLAMMAIALALTFLSARGLLVPTSLLALTFATGRSPR
jgi:MFS family permease